MSKQKRPTASRSKARRAALKYGYRSGLELDIAKSLEERGVKAEYESTKIKWVDHKVRSYTPDFVLPNGIIIESKGVFTQADRRKHLEVKKQYPKLDIRFVFSNPNAKLYKGSKTTYGKWCEKNGFKYSTKDIPDEWVKEKRK